MSDVRLERLTGERLRTSLPELARLRITVFRDFPYLYEGSLAYEERYLQTYAAAADSVIVGAFDGEALVGAATGLPLEHEPESLTRPFAERGYRVQEIFYFGESVLLPAYRGRGIGVTFFAERENQARRLGLPFTTFCAVERPAEHPRRRADYVPLDAFWAKRGYRHHKELRTTFTWRDLDETAESPKPLSFWIKDLSA